MTTTRHSRTRLACKLVFAGLLAASMFLPGSPLRAQATNDCETACTDAYNSCVENCTTLQCANLCELRFNRCVSRCSPE